MTFKSFTFPTFLIFTCGLVLSLPAHAEEIDFSCVDEKVLTKIQVSNRYREFDIVLEHQCPGAVFYSMCIERMDPWTHKRLEALTPSGFVQVDKKMRHNLQMMAVENKSGPGTAFQEFYLNIGYGLDAGVKPQCVASRCEQDKKAIRNKGRANQKSWQQARKALEKKIATECPQTGWEKTSDESCVSNIRQAADADLANYASKDREIQDQLAAVNPQQCSIHKAD